MMWNKCAPIAAAVLLALPAFADNQSNTKTPATKPTRKSPQAPDSLQFGLGTPLNLSGSKAGGSSAGQSSLGNFNPKNPCNQPNPPHSCQQTKPPH
jgi:hypothetical protein